MGLKQDNSPNGDVNRIYINYVTEQWPTDNAPYFEDKKAGIKSTNVRWILKNIYGAKTIGKHTVKSMTFVILDDDGDELHINGSIVQGTKDVFNGLLNNIGNKVSISVYLNKNKYPTGSVRDEKGDFVDNTFFEFNAIDLDGIWAEIEANHGYFLKDGEASRVFVEAANWKANNKEEEISIEDVPF